MLDTVKRKAYPFFRNARGSHNWDHTLRVYRLCDRIGTAEGVEMNVLLTAAYLHDIARGLEDDVRGAICHADKGAQLAAPILARLPLTAGQCDNVLHCIRSHRFRSRHKPRTPEARVLFDADKLDAIGAVGVARAFLFAGEIGARLHSENTDVAAASAYSADDTGYREYIVKLCKIKDSILTHEGRKLAVRRHAVMEAFFNQFIEEYEGKR